ncbi:MAG TPA: UbiA family prenyltransferase, partial [Vicinamibacteria bacterium]|nr:UbiA family prenyltransferase [Vicinamibacteria bacterium]
MSAPASGLQAAAPPGKLRAYVALARPFTLLPPALGVVSGAVTAWGAHGDKATLTAALLMPVLWGALMAAVLNAASNAINQIYDLDIDRVNKPRRPLPAGTLTLSEAWAFTAGSFVLAWVLAWLADPNGRHECFWIVLFTSVLVWAYSAPPLRTKQHGMWANITIAVPRGMLLKVAGWSTVKTIVDVEPWFIGAIFALFLLGAASTKDFADIEGDRAGGCRTLPIEYGVTRAAWIIAPFFVLPFALIPIGVWRGILTGNPVLLLVLAGALIAYGIYTVWLLVRRPEELATTENHPSWTH